MPARKYNSLLLFSVFFCWFFSVMISYTALDSPVSAAVILKAIITGLGIWCGFGILRRKKEVLWFAVAICLYAVSGSLLWLHGTVLLPLINGDDISFGVYDLLAIGYIFGGAIVIWFLLHERTRTYFEKN